MHALRYQINRCMPYVFIKSIKTKMQCAYECALIFNLCLYLLAIETKLTLVWTELRVWQIMNWIADIYVTYFNGTKCQKGLNKWWIVDIIWNEQLCTFILQNFYFTFFFAALETIRFLLISITHPTVTTP